MPGFDYIGSGEARNKKEAQGLAAQQFCQFLVENGLIDPSTLPSAPLPSAPLPSAPLDQPVQSLQSPADLRPPGVSQGPGNPLPRLTAHPQAPPIPPPPLYQNSLPGPSWGEGQMMTPFSQSYGGVLCIIL